MPERAATAAGSGTSPVQLDESNPDVLLGAKLPQLPECPPMTDSEKLEILQRMQLAKEIGGKNAAIWVLLTGLPAPDRVDASDLAASVCRQGKNITLPHRLTGYKFVHVIGSVHAVSQTRDRMRITGKSGDASRSVVLDAADSPGLPPSAMDVTPGVLVEAWCSIGVPSEISQGFWTYEVKLKSCSKVESVRDRLGWNPAGTDKGVTPQGSGASLVPPEAVPESTEQRVTPPAVISKNEPEYSEEASKARIEGDVILLMVVDAQGNVIEPSVQKSLGYGLDEKAIEAAKTWKFKPASRNGVPVPVRVMAKVTFKLF